MKNYRFILASLLAVTLLFVGTSKVLAQGMEEFREDYQYFIEEEQRRLNEIMNSEDSSEWLGVVRDNFPTESNISTYPLCGDCGEFSVSVCSADATLSDEGYHNGFLGLFPTNCYAYYFTSRGVEMCQNCYKILWSYGEHWCWEFHTECERGYFYDVCRMTISD